MERRIEVTFDKEGIMTISGWMLLRLEESIKVPERTLNIVVGWHFRKSNIISKRMKYKILNCVMKKDICSSKNIHFYHKFRVVSPLPPKYSTLHKIHYFKQNSVSSATFCYNSCMSFHSISVQYTCCQKHVKSNSFISSIK